MKFNGDILAINFVCEINVEYIFQITYQLVTRIMHKFNNTEKNNRHTHFYSYQLINQHVGVPYVY